MKQLLFDRVKLFLAVLLLTNMAFFFVFKRSRQRRDMQSQSFLDCSFRRSGVKPQTSPFWNESEKFMNLGFRAKRGIEILLLHKEPHGLVVDVGAGFQALRQQVPQGMSYKPVDLIQRVGGAPTSICNLNRLQFPFFMGEDVSAYFFLGSFEYILDKVSVLSLCRKREAAVVMHYNVGTFGNGEGFEWVAPLSMEALKETAEIAGYKLLEYDSPQQSKEGRQRAAKFLYFQPI